MTSPPSPSAPARTSAARRMAALLAAGALALSACSEGEEGAADPQATGDPTTVSRVSPLTGKVLREQPGHPVLAVKVDNSGSAQQVGLGKADMVVEELVEGGTTRLAAFYYSKLPSDVGPVRSIRATDIGVVSPLEGVLVASGAAPQTWKRVKEVGIKTVSEGGRGFYRGAGSAPYNLFMDMDKLTAGMKPSQQVPEPYLPFGEDGLPKGKKAAGLTAVFSQAADSRFEYQRGQYVNTDGYAREGDDFAPDTVLVLRVKLGLAGYRDPAGYPVPETKFTGKGPAHVFHQGRVVRATWVKKGLDAPVTLQTKRGELALPPGTVRIELVPQGTGSLRIG